MPTPWLVVSSWQEGKLVSLHCGVCPPVNVWLMYSNAISLPSGEISGVNGPWNCVTGPATGAPSLTKVGISDSTLPSRPIVRIRSPVASAAIVPSSACET